MQHSQRDGTGAHLAAYAPMVVVRGGDGSRCWPSSALPQPAADHRRQLQRMHWRPAAGTPRATATAIAAAAATSSAAATRLAPFAATAAAQHHHSDVAVH